ncbi:hypothetical protein PENSPDRAFT_682397 [Peniophora sp. CONT]|nr:hypothetical protein PENSPDRAFT_682397 [Peniophora sp. CONT]
MIVKSDQRVAANFSKFAGVHYLVSKRNKLILKPPHLNSTEEEGVSVLDERLQDTNGVRPTVVQRIRGLSLITLDWDQITYNQSSLPVPWWAQAKIALQERVVRDVHIMISNGAFDNTANKSNVSRILTPKGTFDETWGYITMVQNLDLAQGLKLDHNMKILPRPMFRRQVVATFIHGILKLCVQVWLFSNIKGICTKATCPSTHHHLGCYWPATPVLGRQAVPALTYFFLVDALASII